VTGNPGVNHQVSRCDRRAQTDLWFDEANHSTGGMARATDKPTRQMKVKDAKTKSQRQWAGDPESVTTPGIEGCDARIRLKSTIAY
jgi:hypothetical protein